MRSYRTLMLMGMAVVAAAAVSLVAGAKKHEPAPPPPPPPHHEMVSFYRVSGVVPGQMLFLRERADKDSDKASAIPSDGRCARAVAAPEGEWVQVSYRGVTGYGRTEYLVPDNPGYCSSSANMDPCSRKGKTFRVKGVSSNDVLWIHDQSAKTGNKIGAIPADGSCILYLGASGDWYQISYHGVTGWVNGSFLQRQ